MSASNPDLKVLRVASLTIVNAMIFQQVLAAQDPRIESLNSTIQKPNVGEALFKAWTAILKIDYVPIFTTANDIMRELVGIGDADAALKALAEAALRITGRRAALRHDLMGRIYHRLLADAKYFGAFYTTVPAATLLLKLTLDPSEVPIDWANLGEIGKLKIADLACGTGTLLKATLQTIVDNYVRACADKGQFPDLKAIHKLLVEEVLWGLDVVPFAIHLAGAALALNEPDVEFGTMNLSTLPIGGRTQIRLGSLDLLTGKKVSVQANLFGAAATPSRVSGKGEIKDRIELPQLNLCVMNPPFTRSVGGNLLFGHAPAKERTRMQTALKKVVADEGVPANITAGLGSVFVALGNLRLAPDGQMSLVLPRALLSGVAWTETRRLIGNNYHVKHIIVSHQPDSWNFSENTELSECLIIAQKNAVEATKPTKIINLWTKPKSSVEALTVASLIRKATGASLDDLSGSDELSTSTQKYGEVVLCPPQHIRDGNWNEGAVFAQTELCRAAHFLKAGKVFLPGSGILGAVPMIRFKSIADIGPDRRDIHDGFKVTDQETEYPAFWGHDTESAQAISQGPNKYLMALSHAKKGRNLRDAHLLWSRSGGLLVAERLWLLTTRVFAVKSSERVLSNTWWPVAVHAEGSELETWEKILSLWFNSTLGIMSLIAARVDTRGAWVELKKPILEEMGVLNPKELKRPQRTQLCGVYDEVSKLQIQPFPTIDSDAVHSRIDAVLTTALGISDDLARLRKMLAREPIVSMRLPSELKKDSD